MHPSSKMMMNLFHASFLTHLLTICCQNFQQEKTTCFNSYLIKWQTQTFLTKQWNRSLMKTVKLRMSKKFRLIITSLVSHLLCLNRSLISSQRTTALISKMKIMSMIWTWLITSCRSTENMEVTLRCNLALEVSLITYSTQNHKVSSWSNFIFMFCSS